MKDRKKMTQEEMLVKMAGLCAGAEQCTSDIYGKVIKKGFSNEVADRIVGYLVQNKYIDDSRYARAYAADKVKFAGWGRGKIRMMLKAKRIPESVVTQGLEYIDDKDYEEVLNKVLAAKARSLDLADVKDRQKLYRHLASRGFESALIIPAIRQYIKTIPTDNGQL